MWGVFSPPPLQSQIEMIDAETGVAGCSAVADVRVVISDRRPLMAHALATVVTAVDGFTVTATLAGESAIPVIVAHDPDAVLVGVAAHAHETVRLASSLRARLPAAGIVMIADELDAELVRWVVDGPLTGLLLTDAHPDEIISCLRHVIHGRTVLPSGWQGVGNGPRGCAVDTLSERQLEVLRLLADGLSYEEIATQLFISVNTVKFHLRVIFVRLGVRNRMAAARALAQSARE